LLDTSKDFYLTIGDPSGAAIQVTTSGNFTVSCSSSQAICANSSSVLTISGAALPIVVQGCVVLDPLTANLVVMDESCSDNVTDWMQNISTPFRPVVSARNCYVGDWASVTISAYDWCTCFHRICHPTIKNPCDCPLFHPNTPTGIPLTICPGGYTVYGTDCAGNPLSPTPQPSPSTAVSPSTAPASAGGTGSASSGASPPTTAPVTASPSSGASPPTSSSLATGGPTGSPTAAGPVSSTAGKQPSPTAGVASFSMSPSGVGASPIPQSPAQGLGSRMSARTILVCSVCFCAVALFA